MRCYTRRYIHVRYNGSQVPSLTTLFKLKGSGWNGCALNLFCSLPMLRVDVTGTKLDIHAERSNMSRHNSCFRLSMSFLRCSAAYEASRRLAGQVNEHRQGKLNGSRWRSQSKNWSDNADRGRLIVWSCLERHRHHSALTMSTRTVLRAAMCSSCITPLKFLEILRL